MSWREISADMLRVWQAAMFSMNAVLARGQHDVASLREQNAQSIGSIQNGRSLYYPSIAMFSRAYDKYGRW